LIAQRDVEDTRYLAVQRRPLGVDRVADGVRLVNRSVFLAGNDVLLGFDVSDAANRQRRLPPREDDRFIDIGVHVRAARSQVATDPVDG
jgi:hypothetical protein